METKNISNREKLLHSLCYIPFGWIVLYFIEKNKTKELKKHIRYWTLLFLTYIIVRTVFFFIFWFYFRSLIFLIYLWVAIFYWMKAYNWENFKIGYIDSFENKVKDDFDETPANTTSTTSTSASNNSEVVTENKPEEKKDEFEWYDSDEEEWNSVIDTGNVVMNGIAKWVNKVVWGLKEDVPDEFDDTKKEWWGKKEEVEEKKKDEDVLNF